MSARAQDDRPPHDGAAAGPSPGARPGAQPDAPGGTHPDRGVGAASYQLPPRPMSGKVALPPAPEVLEGRHLLWRDTSILLVAIAAIAAVVLFLGLPGGTSPASAAPAVTAPPSVASPSPTARGSARGDGTGTGVPRSTTVARGSAGAAARFAQGGGAVVACYTAGARAADR